MFFRTAVCAVAFCVPAHAAFADTVGTVRGILTRDGKPVARTVVHLDGDTSRRPVTTDANGRFVFARVPFGRYTLHAEIGGEGARSTTVEVSSDGVLDVVLALDAQTIGRIATTVNGSRATVSENVLDASQIATLPANTTLDRVIETLPGIVRFSYDEPVAHGFHGLTYELDGAPLPRNTSSNFSDLFDVRDAAAIEVFTGAFPAEFGGTRQGAVVNVRSGNDTTPGGTFEVGGGGYDSLESRLLDHATFGATKITIAANLSSTNRGIDAPTPSQIHDNGSLADQFVRIAQTLDSQTTLALDVSNQYASYQIPYAVTDTFQDPVTELPGTDDVQREYDRSLSLAFARASKDGSASFLFVPWTSSSRVAYAGDLAADVQGQIDNGDGTFSPLNGLQQDRRATYVGLNTSYTKSSAIHTVKVGLAVDHESFSGNTLIAQLGMPNFVDVTAQNGANLGAYLQDRWTPNRVVSVQAGVRADRSTGYVDGGQISPRIGLDLNLDPNTVLHGYFGRLYAAPGLEDTRRDAVVTGTSATATPVYDLQPERDSYQEVGVSHRFAPGATVYVNGWIRNVTNVLDTTQLANTPLFAVYNNAIGKARGLEFRADVERPHDIVTTSLTLSRSLAGGISGGTFLFPPSQISDLTLQPEDHDQSVAGNARYTHLFGANRRFYTTLVGEYGTGYPVQFQNGDGRLPSHLTFDLAIGRRPDPATKTFGVELAIDNVTDYQYLIKVNNGFNTTQWAAGARALLRVTAPL
jgi:hypothetical protein